MIMSRHDDRKRSRRDAYESDRDAKEKGDSGFFKGSRALKPDADLAKLGLSEFTPQSGEKEETKAHAIHILPSNSDDAEQNMDLLAMPLYWHWGVGANKETFICPKAQAAFFRSKRMPVPEAIQDGRCAACERHAKLLESYLKVKDNLTTDDRDARWKELKALHPFSGSYRNPRPSRYLVWVVDAESEQTEDEGVKYYQMPTSVYEDGVIELSENDEGEFRDLADPDNGYIFKFKKAGKGLDTSYTGFRVKKRDYSMADWAKGVPSYFDVLDFKTYEETVAVMAVEDEPEEASDKPDKSSKPEQEADKVGDDVEEAFTGRRWWKHTTPDDEPAPPKEDEALDEAFGNATDGNEEPPRRQRSRPAKAEEDEPKEEAPRRRKRPKPDAPAAEKDEDADDDVSPEVKEIRRRRRARQEAKGE